MDQNNTSVKDFAPSISKSLPFCIWFISICCSSAWRFYIDSLFSLWNFSFSLEISILILNVQYNTITEKFEWSQELSKDIHNFIHIHYNFPEFIGILFLFQIFHVNLILLTFMVNMKRWIVNSCIFSRWIILDYSTKYPVNTIVYYIHLIWHWVTFFDHIAIFVIEPFLIFHLFEILE